MKITRIASFALIVGAVALSAVVAAQQAQRPQSDPAAQRIPASQFEILSKNSKPAGPAPTRDLSGSWAGPLEPEMNRDVPPLTPLGQKLMSLNKPEPKYHNAGTNDPFFTTCDPLGFPRIVATQTRGIAFSVMPGRIVILDQYNRVWREVWIDGRPLPKNVGAKGGPDPRWFGYSVGHWENDHTLVVETTGSDDRSWIDKDGHPHSVDALVVERYTRPDHDNLQLSVSITDPKIYTKPYIIATSKFKWIPEQEFEEQICVPSEIISYMQTIGRPAGNGTPAK